MIASALLLLAAAPTALSTADQVSLFKAAGAVRRHGKWLLCAEQPEPYGARVELVKDLNGDGRPEAVIVEDGTFCYGAAGTGYKILSKTRAGTWQQITGGPGVPEFLKTRGLAGWPDISIGGPGFCFPVERWNGKTYVRVRFEYEGKRCKP